MTLGIPSLRVMSRFPDPSVVNDSHWTTSRTWVLAASPDAAESMLKVWLAAPAPTLVRTETRGPLTINMSSAVGTVTDIWGLADVQKGLAMTCLVSVEGGALGGGGISGSIKSLEEEVFFLLVSTGTLVPRTWTLTALVS